MAEQVRIVRIDAAVEHRRAEVRRIMAVIGAVCGVAAVGAVVPIVDSIAGAVVIVAIVAVVAVAMMRWVARRVRWWFEARADARIAAAWRAEHQDAGVGADRARVA